MTSSFLLVSTSYFPPDQLSITACIICCSVQMPQRQAAVAVKVSSIRCSLYAWTDCHHRGPWSQISFPHFPVDVRKCNVPVIHNPMFSKSEGWTEEQASYFTQVCNYIIFLFTCFIGSGLLTSQSPDIHVDGITHQWLHFRWVMIFGSSLQRLEIKRALAVNHFLWKWHIQVPVFLYFSGTAAGLMFISTAHLIS